MVKNKIVCNIFICLLVIMCVTGCNKNDEAISLLHKSAEKFHEADSVRTKIEVDTLFETVSNTTGTKMYLELENTTDPLSGHAVGYSVFERDGFSTGGVVEIYQVSEGEENVTYSRVNDIWTKEKGNNEAGSNEVRSEFLDPDEKPEKFKLKPDITEIEGMETYELTGYMSGKDVMNIFDISAVSGLSGIEDLDIKKLNRTQIPVMINIYKDSALPAKIYVDMTDVLDEIYKDMEENTTVSNFTITVKYEDYGSIEPILVPEEVKQETE